MPRPKIPVRQRCLHGDVGDEKVALVGTAPKTTPAWTVSLASSRLFAAGELARHGARYCFAPTDTNLIGPIGAPDVLGRLKERRKQTYGIQDLKGAGVFLATLGAQETQIDASFCEAVRIAREQKSIALATRAEATHEGIRQSNPPGGRGVFLMHCRHDGNRRG